MNSIKYGLINTINPDYDEDQTKKLEYLYQGSKTIEQYASLFIYKEVARGETDLIYHERLKCVSYRNYMAKIVNDFVADLFSKSFSILPAADASDTSTPGEDFDFEGSEFYRDFAINADLQDHSLPEVLSKVITDGLVTGRAYLGVDFPKVEQMPQNLLEEEQSGKTRAYTYCVPTRSVIDWQMDQFGKYQYVVLKNETIPRTSIAEKRDKRIIQFKVWEKTETGLVKYSIFQIITKLNKEPNKDDECQLIEEGTVSFKEIPIIHLCVPTQLWIGGLIGNLAIEHFRRSSELVYSMKRSLFSIPVYKQGAELPADGGLSEIGTDANRGQRTGNQMKMRGFAVIGPEDDIKFAEPEGKAYVIVDQQLKELIDTIHAVVNQMGNTVAAQKTMVGRSALSKMVDNHAKELVLSAYANLVKGFALHLYKVISEGRNEDIVWRSIGMSDFKMVDRDELITEATQINTIAIPSRTWKKHYLTQLAFSTANDVSAATQETIRREIDQAVDKMTDEQINPPPMPMVDPDEETDKPGDKKPAAKKDKANGK